MSCKKDRYPLLDALRGAAVIDMVIFHFLYDVNVLCGENPAWPYLPEIMLWQRFGLWLFVFIGGMSCALMEGRARWLTGLKLNLLGFAVTAFTAAFAPQERIVCGVLNFFGSALWLTALLENGGRGVLRRMGLAGVGLSLACAALFYGHDGVAFSLAGVTLWTWPAWLCQDAFAILGFHGESFTSADYVPLIPHVFVFWLGYCLLPLVRERAPSVLAAGDAPALIFLGRRALGVYLLHQPLILAGMFLLGML